MVASAFDSPLLLLPCSSSLRNRSSMMFPFLSVFTFGEDTKVSALLLICSLCPNSLSVKYSLLIIEFAPLNINSSRLVF